MNIECKVCNENFIEKCNVSFSNEMVTQYEQKLSEAFRKYPVLYDKNDRNFKIRMKRNQNGEMSLKKLS